MIKFTMCNFLRSSCAQFYEEYLFFCFSWLRHGFKSHEFVGLFWFFLSSVRPSLWGQPSQQGCPGFPPPHTPPPALRGVFRGAARGSLSWVCLGPPPVEHLPEEASRGQNSELPVSKEAPSHPAGAAPFIPFLGNDPSSLLPIRVRG